MNITSQDVVTLAMDNDGKFMVRNDRAMGDVTVPEVMAMLSSFMLWVASMVRAIEYEAGFHAGIEDAKQTVGEWNKPL